MLAVRRFSAIGAIDAAFRLYRRHFAVLFLISLVVNVPATVATLLVTWAWVVASRGLVGDEADLVGSVLPAASLVLAALLVALAVAIVAGMFGVAMTTRVASALARGRPASLSVAFAESRVAFWRLLGASVTVSLACVGGSLFLLVPGLILYLGLVFVAPVVMLEGAAVSEAIERSWRLTTGRRGKVFTALALVALLFGIAIAGLSSLPALFTEADSLLVSLTATFFAQAVAAVATPVWYVAIVLLYYDARVELEAYDVQLLAGVEHS
jgi:membrane-anchored glycerophosphoryl diester phosphodiesterase (GDPDase)